ncbi:YdcF family protein [Nitrospirillum sp. BR 11828]|uniref:YdcF family protein n=1 Tax=Nitrospirillum sp. BR 11828 TaxID=3104325 RepID=UPI002ACA42A0|nr:YdcF family protein [Nitrospirillum sp. BR 11828]MDZ5646402.1 YdcF family protein [Nitrospirillum sp. BR 11828]
MATGARLWQRLRRLTGLGAALGVLWVGGLLTFAANIPRAPEDATAATDAIVVLTGGSERLETGFDLLAAGRAQKLFISGVYRGVDVRALLRLSQATPAALECCVVLGYSADDTVGNAAETARWMQAEGYHSLRLVTANYHMPRSLVEFRHALPDVRIVPHAVQPPNVRLDGWWHWRGTAGLIVSEYDKYLVAFLRHALGL